MPTPGPLELVIILVIALLILGPGKLPEVGSALGKSIREFRKASSDVQEAVKVNVDTAPLPAPTAPAAETPPATLTDAQVEERIAAAVAAAKADSTSAATPPAADPTTAK
jgi:TatA/E family protein of Tat protein translocase